MISCPPLVRIAIDARKLHDFGIGTYLRNLVRQLARLDGASEYLLLCRPDDTDLAAQLGPNFRAIPEASSPYSVAEQVTIPARLARERVDLFHTPHYVLPPLVRCRSVVTIHDCIHLMFPQYLPNRFAHVYAKAFMWSATHLSDAVLTVSEASKRDILRFFDIDPGKVTVIPNAIDEDFLSPPDEAARTLVRERFQIAGDFLLYVGNIKPHKNVERLIDAFHELHRSGFEDLTLIVIGDDSSKYATLRRAVHRYKLHKAVRFLGFVSGETLSALYALARVFVFPSLYEGFGLPPLEALAMGTPVVTSNVSSLPEVVGDAAVLIDPYDAQSIADGIRRVLTDEALRAELQRRGPLRAREFSWEASVRRVLCIYQGLAAPPTTSALPAA
ncbi:MAG: glycosyltransferase family 1 protein [Vicinamibacterales bacterium]